MLLHLLPLPAHIHIFDWGPYKLKLIINISVEEAEREDEMKTLKNGIPEGDTASILASWLQHRTQRQLAAQLKPESKRLWELPPSLQVRLDLPPSLHPITVDSFTDADFEEWGWILVFGHIRVILFFHMCICCVSHHVSLSPQSSSTWISVFSMSFWGMFHNLFPFCYWASVWACPFQFCVQNFFILSTVWKIYDQSFCEC